MSRAPYLRLVGGTDQPSAIPLAPDEEVSFVDEINRLADLWASLPDDHPIFDGGRRLLEHMRAEKPRRT